MAFELRDGQGTLFKNDKQGNEQRPDYRGEINVGGQVYNVSGWIKEGKAGKWMSLSVQPKEAKPEQRPAPKTKPGADFDEDIPFLSRDHGRGDIW